jgi:hypothetical protein
MNSGPVVAFAHHSDSSRKGEACYADLMSIVIGFGGSARKTIRSPAHRRLYQSLFGPDVHPFVLLPFLPIVASLLPCGFDRPCRGVRYWYSSDRASFNVRTLAKAL